MKRENWVFDNWYDYDLIFDETGELRHPIVDGKIEYNYYYEGMTSSKESNWEPRLTTLKSKIKVNYDKLIKGNQAYVDLDIKPGDIVRSIRTSHLDLDVLTEEWVVITPDKSYYPSAVVIKDSKSNNTISINSDYIDLNSDVQFFSNFRHLFIVYLKENTYKKELESISKKRYDNKMYNILVEMQSLSKEDQQKIIQQL